MIRRNETQKIKRDLELMKEIKKGIRSLTKKQALKGYTMNELFGSAFRIDKRGVKTALRRLQDKGDKLISSGKLKKRLGY